MAKTSTEQAARRLGKATSIEAVVAAARKYIAGWDRHALAKVPENCRPGEMADAADVESWADILETEVQSGEIVSAELRQMHDFFAAAAQRIHELRRNP